MPNTGPGSSPGSDSGSRNDDESILGSSLSNTDSGSGPGSNSSSKGRTCVSIPSPSSVGSFQGGELGGNGTTRRFQASMKTQREGGSSRCCHLMRAQKF